MFFVQAAGRRGAPPVAPGLALRVRGLAFRRAQYGGAVLVGALVAARAGGELVVARAQALDDVLGGHVVISGPRLVAAQRFESLQHRAAVVRLALVDLDLRQV